VSAAPAQSMSRRENVVPCIRLFLDYRTSVVIGLR
jgi:hypothetical protein